MQTEDSRSLVKKAWSEFASRDPDRIATMFAEDAEWLAPPDNATAVALGGTNRMSGRDAVANFIATGTQRLFSNRSVTFRGMYADGPVVVVELQFSAQLPDGRDYANDYCFIFECRGGKIAQVREYMDTLAGHRQIFANGDPLKAATV
jgi:uncharacterized protein